MQFFEHDLDHRLAIYFLIWWLTLFAVLPFGIRSQHEARNRARNRSRRPDSAATSLEAVLDDLGLRRVFAVLYVIYAYRLIGLDDIPGLPRPLPAS